MTQGVMLQKQTTYLQKLLEDGVTVLKTIKLEKSIHQNKDVKVKRNTPLERDIEKRVKAYAESKGWLTRKWTSPGHAFVPDQIFITPHGKVIFIEMKREGKKPTLGQIREHEKLRNHNCLVFVIDSVEAGKELVNAHTE